MLTQRDIDIITERLCVAKICRCGNCICCDTAKEWELDFKGVKRKHQFLGFGMGDDNAN